MDSIEIAVAAVEADEFRVGVSVEGPSSCEVSDDSREMLGEDFGRREENSDDCCCMRGADASSDSRFGVKSSVKSYEEFAVDVDLGLLGDCNAASTDTSQSTNPAELFAEAAAAVGDVRNGEAARDRCS